ncbi:hypothetical protein [uncultured Imperialibacter sp.]|uniref:hypothetical protein n=1 Tax=uncultured Imperialibacter sp. TaxID=1672639 RepID=UPI0030DC4B98
MRVTKTVLIIFFMLGACIVSCLTRDGSCESGPPHFRIKGIESTNMRLTTSEPNPWRKIIGNEQVLWDSFFISFNFQADYIAAIVSDYGQSLMALECAEQGYAGDKIGVDTIFVRTMYDYNDTYAAGDTINQIVLIKDWIFFYDDFEKFVPLSNYIVDNHNGVIDQQFQFKLSEAPGKGDSFSIQLSFILNNGEVFQHTTNPLVLTK